MPTRTNADLIDAIDDVLGAALTLARDLTEDDAALPTECPGWTVKDQLAHMVGLEQLLGGAPEPAIELPPLAHVSGDIAIFMEKPVHIRRPLPLVAVADELAGFRPRRIAELRQLAATGDPDVQSPFGLRPLSVSLPVRIFDLWAHEQDVRRAIGLPARIEGAAAAISMERALLGWSGALPKALPDTNGQLVIRVTGPVASETVVTLGDGGPAAVLTGDLGELTRIFCGRIVADDSALSGDAVVVEALRPRLGLTP